VYFEMVEIQNKETKSVNTVLTERERLSTEHISTKTSWMYR